MNLQLFPYPGADGFKSSFVRSTTSPEVAQVPDFSCYSQSTLRFKPVEQVPGGPYNARTQAFNATGYTAVAMLYTKAAGGGLVPLAATPVMSWAGSLFEGVLDLNTAEAISATSALAAGASIPVRFVFILFNGSGQPTIVEQSTRLFYTVPPDDLPDPTSITTNIFLNLLQLALGDSNSIEWRRVLDLVYGDVRRAPLGGIGESVDGLYTQRIGDAPAILPALATGFTVSGYNATPTDDTDAVTLGGVTGQLYKIKARVVGTTEQKGYSGGTQTPGDSTRVSRGGTPAADNYNLWYLDISNPPQRIHLNKAPQPPAAPLTFAIDYFVDFLAYAGATVTLGFDTLDALSLLANDVAVTQELAEEFVPNVIGRQTIWVPANAITARTTDGPATYSAELVTNKVMQAALSFDPDTAQFAQFEVAMPKSWDRGDVFAEILWQSTGGTGDVLWSVQAVAVSNGDALDAAFGAATEVVDTMLGADTLHVAPETAAIVIAGTPAAGDLVTFQVSRNATDGADTFDGDALLKGVRLIYKTETGNDD